MFPGSNASVYYNEDGEPLGWDAPYVPDPYDLDDRRDEAPDVWGDVAECITLNLHGESGTGTDDPDIFTCDSCGEKFSFSSL